VGLDGRVARVDGRTGWLAGVQMAFVVDHRTTIGVEAVGLVSTVELSLEQRRAIRQFLYGGLLLEYAIEHRAVVHPLVRVTIGGGGVSLEPLHSSQIAMVAGITPDIEMGIDPSSELDGFVLFEPGAGVELNIDEHLRLEFALLYRLIADVSTPGVTNGMLNGPSLSLTLKSGLF
jgi:hypothetical protein